MTEAEEKMYNTLFNATEDAINLLINAQRTCEEICLSAPEPDLKVLTFQKHQEKSTDET